MDDHAHCQYRSKLCTNARSRKNDGSLHRFCSLHRAKANDAQRRWHARQRRQHGSHSSRSSDESDHGSSPSQRSVEVGWSHPPVMVPRLSLEDCGVRSVPVDDMLVAVGSGFCWELDEMIVEDEYVIATSSASDWSACAAYLSSRS